MEKLKSDPTLTNSSSNFTNSGKAGVCMMNTKWREEQHPPFLNFISSFLTHNSFRLNFVPIAPDFIFNCGGLSVAFIFLTNWDSDKSEGVFSRVEKLKSQFQNLYVLLSLPTHQHHHSFARSYFEYKMEVGRPTFVQAQDMEMGFEKIVKIALSRGACKRKDVVSKLKVEKKRSVEAMEAYLKVVTAIPRIDKHDANSLYQAIGSIEAIANASKESIVESTDLSGDKAEMITRFFSDPKFSLTSTIN